MPALRRSDDIQLCINCFADCHTANLLRRRSALTPSAALPAARISGKRCARTHYTRARAAAVYATALSLHRDVVLCRMTFMIDIDEGSYA